MTLTSYAAEHYGLSTRQWRIPGPSRTAAQKIERYVETSGSPDSKVVVTADATDLFGCPHRRAKPIVAAFEPSSGLLYAAAAAWVLGFGGLVNTRGSSPGMECQRTRLGDNEAPALLPMDTTRS
jgi:hypothetical protein